MAKAVISKHYAHIVDSTKCPLAYECREVASLKQNLLSDDLTIRQKALISLCDLLHDPHKIYEVIREGIIEILKGILSDQESFCRVKATECLFIATRHTAGRDSFIDNAVTKPLAELMTDPDDEIRLNVQKIFEICSVTPYGAQEVVDAGLISLFVDRLSNEHEQIQEIILDTLHHCFRVDANSALKTDAMEVLGKLLQHDSASIKAKTARNIMSLGVTAAGKKSMIEVQCIPSLITLLGDADSDVRASAAGALMIATITSQGKYTALAHNVITPLVHLLEDTCTEVRTYALKVISCLAEAPEGREQLQPYLTKIEERLNDDFPAVVQTAKITLKQVKWSA